MYFDRFDIIEAYYLFLSEFHEGQGSDKYRKMCSICRYFRPSPQLRYDSLSDNAKVIYNRLVREAEHAPAN